MTLRSLDPSAPGHHARAVRFINIPFGAWLIVAPWLLDGVPSTTAAWGGVLCGVLLIVLALRAVPSGILMRVGIDTSFEKREKSVPGEHP